MSALMPSYMARHSLIDWDGWGESSADPADYWDAPDDFQFEGASLVRLNHPYLTITGKIVLAPRELKSAPRLRDLKRLRKAIAAARLAATLDTTGTLDDTGE